MMSHRLPLLLAALACAVVSAMPLGPGPALHNAGAHAPLPLGRTLLQTGGGLTSGCEQLRETYDAALADIQRLNDLIEAANEGGEPQQATRSLLGQLRAAEIGRAHV